MVLFDNIEDLFQSVREFSDYTKALITLATAIGALVMIIVTLKFLYSLLNGLRLYVLNQYCCSSNYVQKYGKWAVVTGATDGIGFSMAKELAQRGHSIIIVGRNEEKLARSKTALEAEPNVGEVVTIKIDLADSSLANYERIKGQIDADNRDIGILINNAGTFPGEFKPFTSYPMQDSSDLVNVNILATVYFTRLILPSFLRRKKGLLVNVSSIISYTPVGYNNAYGPTKSFVNAFSEMLYNELSSTPIDVVNLTPGGVHTKLLTAATVLQKAGLINPSPEDYARSAINAIATPILFTSGTMIHGIFCKMTILLRTLGLDFYAFKASIKMTARNFKETQTGEEPPLVEGTDSAQ